MHNQLTTETLKRCLHIMAHKMEICFDELNALDNQVGDGDIGVTMATGFKEILIIINELPDNLSESLTKCAQAFTKTCGASFGTLFATGLLAAAKEIKGEKELVWSRIPDMLSVSIEQMAQRGRSKLGDKTMLDGLSSIQKAISGIEDPDEMLKAANNATLKVLEDFKNKPCKQGRARIFADKTIGLDDPGMLVIRRLIEGLNEAK